MVVADAAHEVLVTSGAGEVGACAVHGIAVAGTLDLHPLPGAGLRENLRHPLRILELRRMQDLTDQREAVAQVLIEQLHLHTEDAGIVIIVIEVRVRVHIEVHAAGVQQNIRGQVLEAVLLRIHIREHSLQETGVRQLLLGEALRVEIQAEIHHAAGILARLEQQGILHPLLLPVIALGLLSDIGDAEQWKLPEVFVGGRFLLISLQCLRLVNAGDPLRLCHPVFHRRQLLRERLLPLLGEPALRLTDHEGCMRIVEEALCDQLLEVAVLRIFAELLIALCTEQILPWFPAIEPGIHRGQCIDEALR